MKKMYITPEVEAIEVQIEAIIALSTQDTEIGSDNKDDFENLGREDNPSRPNIWEQGW
ncbi:MAG: hypothetical protein J6S07_04150 [Bacteroidaceae bacterium]|nr:hypothetical protein [Bacteroidaceae bacterium]